MNLFNALKRLGKKFTTARKGLSDMLEKVLSKNGETIADKVANITNEQMEKSRKRVKDGGLLIAPELNEIKLGRSVIARKSFEKGEEIANTLKDRINKKLNKVLEEEGLIAERGRTAGRIKISTIQKFEKELKETYKDYTKKNPRYGMPSNIHTIATTEVRSAVNEIKTKYTNVFIEKNNGQAVKSWVHNRHLSIKPRQHHMNADGQTVDNDKEFILKKDTGEIIKMRYPHDPLAPPSEVINCNCDVEYFVAI